MSQGTSALLLGSYRPGHTWLHRLPAGAKLVGLMLASVVVVTLRGPGTALGALAVSVAIVASSGMGLRLTLRALRGIVLVALLLAAFAAWQRNWALAVEQVADLVALVLLATVLTATTAVDAILDAITRGLRPLSRVGVNPERVALAFSLVLRAIPTTMEIAQETRAAARARGLERDPRALLTPMVIRSVAHARHTGEALHARGIGDD
ncbi:energy-coupling factor transporter transmembrane protein EcfT [Nocardioides sp. 616]|uniref:energy-coupling factor transporter transmembrane component T family protein n=1 Tax=Nocardioides sp. 616 TaxID=2268090 RepID=UPI000CE41D8D|nr:energy-coupling factor transporter transmembrane protein EcfT [Nocardioides sp. 616]